MNRAEPTTCDVVRPLLVRFVEGELAAAPSQGVRAHLDHCPACRKAAAETQALLPMLARLRAAPAGRPSEMAARARAKGEAMKARHARILARAGWVGAAAAAAATFILAVVLLTRPPEYPAPVAEGDYTLMEGTSVTRGALLATGEAPARLRLGGYCQIEVAPASRVQLQGEAGREEIRLKEGAVTCDIHPGRGGFSVVTEVGTASVVGTRFQVRFDRGGTVMRPRQMWVKVLVGAVLLTTAHTAERLYAGEEKKVVAQEIRQGTIEGTVLGRNAAATVIEVKIEKVLAGDPAILGQTIAFAVRWTRNAEGQWVPNPDDVRLLRSPPAGGQSKVRIEYTLDERYRLKSLTVLAAPEGGTISAGQPSYVPRAGAAWQTRGRIVGPLRNAPLAEISALNAAGQPAAAGQPVKSVRIEAGRQARPGGQAYEVGFLEPGLYALRVEAQGYKTLNVPNLEVKARHDLVLAVEFSTPQGKTIGHSQPEYQPREGADWQNAGRIIGRLIRCPGAEMTILRETTLVTTLRVGEGQQEYATPMLAPGLYTLRVAARGYATLELRVEVKAKAALSITLEF